jgi:uncharacterized protein (DUF2252 family)
MKPNVVERIQRFNQGRNPQLLQLKYQAMRSDIFTFFRGTCHLFYEDWSANSSLDEAPLVWICGDLHLENFGSYKGDNRLVYFDINDFDEAAIAPCTWDLARFLTSVLVAARTLGVNEPEALCLCNSFLDAYTNALAKGKARWVETETAEGMVKDLLESLKERSRKDFLNKRTAEKKGKRRLLLDDKLTRPIAQAERSAIEALIKDWAATQPDPNFFKLLDVAVRVAGTGSLGVARYVLLIEGKGSPDQNYLLDLKQEHPSSLAPYLNHPQPRWESEAARVVAIQQRVQGTPPALLGTVLLDGDSYLLRELQPLQDKVSLNLWKGKLRRLEKVMKVMGEIVAWDQLRSSGRQGSAIADELIQFATAPHWRSTLLDYAQSYFTQVEEDYRTFCLEMPRHRPRAEGTGLERGRLTNFLIQD